MTYSVRRDATSISGVRPVPILSRRFKAIIDWLSATGLRRFTHTLTPAQQKIWLQHYTSLLEKHYPLREDGTVMLPCSRLFIVARKRL